MPGRVLLIEDEPNIIEAIRFILTRDGWSVDVHSDGATATDAIAQRAPDLVILDEPTSALTDAEAEILFSIVRSLKEKGTGIIYISHRLNEITEIADTATGGVW